MGDTPFAFVCPVARREVRRPGGPSRLDGHRDILRTGRVRPNPSRKIGPRTLTVKHEYECECGHRGWSTHADILRYPVMG